MELLSDLLAFLAGAPAFVVPAVTALVIFLTSDWRVSLIALLLQYIFIGVGLTRYQPFEVALAKTVAGALAVLILFLSARQIAPPPPDTAEDGGLRFFGLRIGWLAGPLGLPFRFLTFLLVVLVLTRVYAGGSLASDIFPSDVVLLAAWMATVGFVGLVLSGNSLRVAAAFLTILSGFDVIYAGLDPGLAIAGAFGAFTLVAALGFSYLVAVEVRGPGQAEAEEREP
jgi:hypothetical protein